MQEPTTNQADTDVKRSLSSYSPPVMSVVDAPEKGIGWKKVNITQRGTGYRLAKFGIH